MLIKASVLGLAALGTPVLITQSQQEPPKQERGETAGGKQGVKELQRKLRQLETQVHELQEALRRARQEQGGSSKRLRQLQAQLDEALDLIEKGARPVAHRSCTPSRSRSLITKYQWMQERGHEARAKRLLTKVIKEHGGRNSSLNTTAWYLMTEKSTAGRFDAAALALAESMLKHGRLKSREYDTLALAQFLNGQLADAVKAQRAAIAMGSTSTDYRRRLRVYEAALARHEAQREAVSVAAAGGGGDE